MPKLGVSPKTAAAIMYDLRPDYAFRDITEIDREFLDREGIRLVIWDVDGTLMAYHDDSVPVQLSGAFLPLTDGEGIRHAILSNCDERRFEELGEIFRDLPVCRAYSTPGGPVYRRLLRGKDTHTGEGLRELLRVGEMIRKPNAAIIPLVMKDFGLTDPDRVLVVGDQHLTDVATAKLAGAKAARVNTFRRETFPPSIRFSQRLERVLYAVRHPIHWLGGAHRRASSRQRNGNR